MEVARGAFPIAFTILVGSGDIDRVRSIILPDGRGCKAKLNLMSW